jgi:hypothetical protein
MVNRRPSGQAANVKNAVISLQKLLSPNAATMCSSQLLAGLESLIRVRQTESAFHRPAQQNAFRHRGACLQQRSFARENPRLRRSQLQLGLLRLLAMIFPNFILFERGSFP